METEAMVGAFTAFRTNLTPEDKKIFQEAMGGLVGVTYTPLAVSTQVVNGTNYKFFCNAKAVHPGATNEGAMVHIHHPVNGKAHVTSIQRCH